VLPAAAAAGGGGGGGGDGQQQPGRIVVGFSPAEPHTLVVVTQAGTYHRIQFDPARGGPMADAFSCSFLPWPAAGDADGGDVGGEAVLV
jgi:hypothetical protein